MMQLRKIGEDYINVGDGNILCLFEDKLADNGPWVQIQFVGGGHIPVRGTVEEVVEALERESSVVRSWGDGGVIRGDHA